MKRKLFYNLIKSGYEYVELSKDDCPILSLSKILETYYIQGILYKNLIDDNIYLIGTRYKQCSINNDGYTEIKSYRDSTLEVDLYHNGNEVAIEKATKIQNKLNDGYKIMASDILGNFIDKKTNFQIKYPGIFVSSFYCEDLILFLREFKGTLCN